MAIDTVAERQLVLRGYPGIQSASNLFVQIEGINVDGDEVDTVQYEFALGITSEIGAGGNIIYGLNIAAETDSSLALVTLEPQVIAVGLTTETDSSLAMTSSVVIGGTIGIATEYSTAFPVIEQENIEVDGVTVDVSLGVVVVSVWNTVDDSADNIWTDTQD